MNWTVTTVSPWIAIALLGVTASASAQDLTEARRVEVARNLQRSAVVVACGPSTGSGFVTADERWVITNAHVVQGFRRYGARVRFGDRSSAPAQVVAFDQERDLAILEVDGEVPAPGLPLGDSDAVEVGQTVLAFGSPFGLEGTLTQGIVSARREVPAPGGGGTRRLIQTDAPINPGNSGGPLVSSRGEVIGVNSAILSRSGGSHGIGFAVPANEVRDLLRRLREHRAHAEPAPAARSREPVGPQQARAPPPAPEGDAPRDPPLGPVWLGIYGDDFRGRGFAGVRVQQVVPGGPAATAGLLGAGDPAPPFVRRMGIQWTGHIILAVDGHPVRSMQELTGLLSRRRPGDRSTVFVTVGPGVVSGEAQVELSAPPSELPPLPRSGAASP